jgi:hypothetical protein
VIDDGGEVGEVAAQRLTEPALRLVHHLAVRPDAAPREVERHRRVPGQGEPVGDLGKEPPVLEPLEAVADDHRRPHFAQAGTGAHVHVERAAVGPAQPERC